MSKVTGWYPGQVSPVRRGWYEVGCSKEMDRRFKAHLTGRPFRYWNGSNWLVAPRSWISIFGKYEGHQWRGLLKSARRKT